MTLGLSPVKTLRFFRFNVTKDKSASDTSQEPVGSASVTVYKQGATADGGGSIAEGGSGTITVHNKGRIAVNDSVFLNTDTTITANVTAVTQTTVVVNNVSGGTLTWVDGDRVHASNNQPTLYSDILSGSAAITNPLTADARGLAECYAEDFVVDVLISHATITTRQAVDQTGAWPLGEVLDASSYAGATADVKIAAALADLDSTYGGIVDARGLVEAQSFAADPFSGITKPYLVLLGAAIYDSDVALAIGLSDNQQVRGLGAGITTIRADGTNFPDNTVLLTMGASADKAVVLSDLTLDCNSMTTSKGLLVTGCDEGSSAERIEVLNAVTYGVRVDGAASATRNFALRDVRITTADASAIGLDLPAGQGFGNSAENISIEGSPSGADAVQINAIKTWHLKNIRASGYTDIIDIQATAAGGPHVIDGVTGASGVTNLLKVASGSCEYVARDLVRNSATNVVNDADMAAGALTDDRIAEIVSGQIIVVDRGDDDPAITIDILSGATATKAAIQMNNDGTNRFELQKSGELSLSKVNNDKGHTPSTGTLDIGSGGTAVLQSGSTDMAGNIIVTTGTSTPAGASFVLTFGEAYGAAPVCALVLPFLDGSAIGNWGPGEHWYVSAVSTSSITIAWLGTPDDSQAYRLAYFVIGG